MDRSYEKAPTRHSTEFDFSGSNTPFYFKGPKGKAGRLYDYGVEAVTTAFAGSTTPMMSIGTAADDDHYGDTYDFSTLAVASGTKSIRTTYVEGVDAGFDTYMLLRELPADTVVMMTLTASTGSAAGVATCFADVIWDP